MSRCPSCSTDVPPDARFCPSCGEAMTATSAPTEALPHPAPSPPTPVGSSSDPDAVHGRFLPGSMLGTRYRIVGLLGRGGMGEVYRADDLELGQSVAMKFLPERLAADPLALERLRGEVRNARQISHPNVCRVYDISQVDGHTFLTMEYVDGDDLAHVLRRLGPPSRDKALEIARQLCMGLAAAHENKMLHRDLKPANVMLDGRGRVRIMDFGLAGLVEELEAGTDRAGTPAYMAPEQLESGTVSVRSDIYSLGLLLYELFTGKQAFSGRTLDELRRARSSGSLPSMQSLVDAFDPAVERAIRHCLEPDPADRPRGVYEILAALPGGDPLAAALAAGETPSPEMVAGARERGGLSPRRAMAMLAVVILALGFWMTVSSRLVVMPGKTPTRLEADARAMLRDLGHELPTREAQGLIANETFLSHRQAEGGSAWDERDDPWPPPYLFWLRASPASLQTTDLHWPITGLGDPLASPPGSVTIVLGSSERLVELEVVPDASTVLPETAAPADWSTVLHQAGLDPTTLEPTEPAREIPSYCDEVVAYRVDRSEAQGGPYVFQTGAHRGRVVHATTVWDWDRGGPIAEARHREFESSRGISDQIIPMFFTLILLLSAFLAWRNVRLGRGDRRGAFVYGGVVFALYVFFDAANTRLSEFGIGSSLYYLLSGNPLGHAAVHAIQTGLAYLAVEPYVRKIWPHALIGWARLTRGRWRDPVVGRETLIGIFSMVLAGSLMGVGTNLAQSLAGRPVVELFNGSAILGDTSRMVTEMALLLAVAMLNTIQIYFLLLVLRLAVRRDWLTVLAGVVTASGVFTLTGLLRAEETTPFVATVTVVVSAFFFATMMLVIVRVGLIAAITFLFFADFVGKIPMTLNLSAFYAPQAMLGIALVLAVALYGFRYSLAGQPVFKDILASPDL